MMRRFSKVTRDRIRNREGSSRQLFDSKRRKRIRKALGTDGSTEAELRAPIMRAGILAELRAWAGHHLKETLEERVRRPADLASGRGFGFRTAAEIAEEPLEKRLRWVEAIEAEEPGSEIESATVRAPSLRMSGHSPHAGEPVIPQNEKIIRVGPNR